MEEIKYLCPYCNNTLIYNNEHQGFCCNKCHSRIKRNKLECKYCMSMLLYFSGVAFCPNYNCISYTEVHKQCTVPCKENCTRGLKKINNNFYFNLTNLCVIHQKKQQKDERLKVAIFTNPDFADF